MTQALSDLIKVVKAFCKEHRHGTLTIHVRHRKIQGVETNTSKYIKLPLSD